MSSKSSSKDWMSDELRSLLHHQYQIKSWLTTTNSRIVELEEQYLEETQLGNIIRGWEIDGRPPLIRSRGIEDKEKIFSNSSYQLWFSKTALGQEAQEKKSSKAEGAPSSSHKKKSSSHSGGSSSHHHHENHSGHHSSHHSGHHSSHHSSSGHKSKKHKKSSSSSSSANQSVDGFAGAFLNPGFDPLG